MHPVPRFIYSLDWLQDPRYQSLFYPQLIIQSLDQWFEVLLKHVVSNICSCVLLSFDDGTLRILSLVKVAYDVPATGRPYPNTKQQGLSVYNCSTFPIWSIQVSRLTGKCSLWACLCVQIRNHRFIIINKSKYNFSGIAAYCTADGSIFHFEVCINCTITSPLMFFVNFFEISFCLVGIPYSLRPKQWKKTREIGLHTISVDS